MNRLIPLALEHLLSGIAEQSTNQLSADRHLKDAAYLLLQFVDETKLKNAELLKLLSR